MNKKRVVVAMSGGVDSSVAAALLKKQGFDVVGMFLKFWQPPFCASSSKWGGREIAENICCNQEALSRARQVAAKLRIPFYVFDVSKEFKKQVVDYFIDEYSRGKTPNPCVVCNKSIKFKWLFDFAKKINADFVATGHYARLKREVRNPKPKIRNKPQISNKLKIKNYKLLRGKDKKKDQSYFLWKLNQKELAKVLFPLGKYTKKEVYRLVRKCKLPVAERKESQEVCFIPDHDISGFLRFYLKKEVKPGFILDCSGNVLGKHKGLVFYTVGQRKNLGLGGQKSDKPLPLYVVKKDTANNLLIVDKKKNIWGKNLIAEKLSFINSELTKKAIENTKNLRAQIRYRQKPTLCRVKFFGKKAKVIFKKPVWAITPGQSIVFYLGNQVQGGGIIKESF